LGRRAANGHPQGLPPQIHVIEGDERGDVDVAREVAETIDTTELFLYLGDRHLFADGSLADFDPSAAALLTRRVLAFLQHLSWLAPRSPAGRSAR
jgi:dienelactone hydrolase